MDAMTTKVAKLSTKQLIEMAEMLVNNLSDEAMVIAAAVESVLENRLSEAGYLAHVDHLEALEAHAA